MTQDSGKPSFSRRPAGHRRQYPACLETSCFLIKFSYTQNDGNISKGIILGRFPVTQHSQTSPSGLLNYLLFVESNFQEEVIKRNLSILDFLFPGVNNVDILFKQTHNLLQSVFLDKPSTLTSKWGKRRDFPLLI